MRSSAPAARWITGLLALVHGLEVAARVFWVYRYIPEWQTLHGHALVSEVSLVRWSALLRKALTPSLGGRGLQAAVSKVP